MIIKSGDIVVIKELKDNWEEHYFLVQDVHEDVITGMALTGELKNTYGEPELSLIKKVYHETAN